MVPDNKINRKVKTKLFVENLMKDISRSGVETKPKNYNIVRYKLSKKKGKLSVHVF